MKLSDVVKQTLAEIVAGEGIVWEDFESLKKEEQKLVQDFISLSITKIWQKEGHGQKWGKYYQRLERALKKKYGGPERTLKEEEYDRIFMEALKNSIKMEGAMEFSIGVSKEKEGFGIVNGKIVPVFFPEHAKDFLREMKFSEEKIEEMLKEPIKPNIEA